MNRADDDLRATNYIVRHTNSKEIKSGIIKDVIKLSDSYGIREEYHGVILAFWADPKVRQNLDPDSVRNSVIEQVRREKQKARTTRLELFGALRGQPNTDSCRKVLFESNSVLNESELDTNSLKEAGSRPCSTNFV